MATIKSLTERIIAFRDARDWKQFHRPKDIAIALVLEAAEVIEHFQWKNDSEVEKYLSENKDKLAEEMADVLYCLLLMGHDVGIDVVAALDKKMSQNEKKYPVALAKGSAKKYTEYLERM